MRVTIRRGLAAIAIAAAGITGLAPSAAPQPSIYHPVITPCSHLFRTPLEPPRPGTAVYWSPFGTSDIACYDDGTGIRHRYQRDPSGTWHDMNELAPGQWFYVIYGSTVPNQATWA
ncbi:hypothetical protein ACFVMC_27715 [Nocardia sp. NPDC127579]|uniref:hypothetical protein n=1 Tax=Nocardia sp. NPDC127579 TaxID=3345402 RepID=UPI003635AB01